MQIRDQRLRPPLAKRRRRRRGVAVAELAVCLPVLTLVVFGSLQACNLLYLKHAVVTATYEATLELSKRNATNSSVVARAQQVLDARGVTSSTIRILPASVDVSTASLGQEVSIEVTAEVRPNVTLSTFFPMPRNVQVTMAATH
jgi:Flp pilus assembly protein TadG